MNRYEEITKEKLDELAEQIHKINLSKGFWQETGIITKSSLIISELYELVEAHRKDRWANTKEYLKTLNSSSVSPMQKDLSWLNQQFEHHIKDTIQDELADAIIRTLDLSYYLYDEAMLASTEHTSLDYEDIAELEPTENNEDLHVIILSLASVVSIGPEYVLEPLFILADLLGMSQEDILFHIREKVSYNNGRPKLHGKKY